MNVHDDCIYHETHWPSQLYTEDYCSIEDDEYKKHIKCKCAKCPYYISLGTIKKLLRPSKDEIDIFIRNKETEKKND